MAEISNNLRGQFFSIFFFKYENNFTLYIDKILNLQFECKNYVNEKRSHYEIK